MSTATFEMKIDAPSQTPENLPTEVFVPPFHFPVNEMQVTASDGKWEYDDSKKYLKWWHASGQQSLKIVGVKRVSLLSDESGWSSCSQVCSVM